MAESDDEVPERVYRAVILPQGNYAVVDQWNNVVRRYNTHDDAAADARRRNEAG